MENIKYLYFAFVLFITILFVVKTLIMLCKKEVSHRLDTSDLLFIWFVSLLWSMWFKLL